MIPMTQMSLVVGVMHILSATDGMIHPPSVTFASLFTVRLHVFSFFHHQASNMSDSIMIARACVKAIWQPLENSSFRDENPRPGSLRLPAFSFQPGGSHQFRAVATFEVGHWATTMVSLVELTIKHGGLIGDDGHPMLMPGEDSRVWTWTHPNTQREVQ